VTTGGRLLRRGELTLFLAGPDGRHRRVVTISAPAMMMPGPAPSGYRWLERAGLDAVIVTDATSEEVAAATVRTIEAMGDVIRPAAVPPGERVIRIGTRPTFVAATRTAVVEATSWVRAVEGSLSLAGHRLPATGAPVAARLAMRSDGYTAAAAHPLGTVDAPNLAAGLAWIFEVAAELALAAAEEDAVAVAGRVAAAPGLARATQARAVRLLAAELGTAPEPPPRADDPLVACAAMVAQAGGMSVRTPQGGMRGREGADAVRAVALASGLYARQVQLRGPWWRDADAGVLGFRPDGRPVAFVPEAGRLVAVDADGGRVPVDLATADAFLDVGFVLAAPIMDAGEVPSIRSLLTRATRRRRRDLTAALGWAAAIGLLALAVPLASGVVFGQIVPQADTTRLAWLLVALSAVAVAGLPLQIAFGASMTRAEASVSLDLQRTVWGRVLRSPVTLANRLGPGDLAHRLGGLERARDPLDQAVLKAVPTVLAAVAAAFVLFTYDALLAFIVLGFGTVIGIVTVWLAQDAARRQAELGRATGAMNGFVLQVLSAIPKLRVAAAESRAFLAWAERFRDATGRAVMRAVARTSLVTGITSTLGTLVLYATITVIGPATIPLGRLLAFQVSLGIFLTGVASLAGAAAAITQQRPTVRSALELAATPVESGPGRADPGPLRGSIALAGVTFRYVPAQRPVLDGVSLRIEPGELVAVAGHSGSGKSTIIRVLLGFEQPEQGSVLFDDKDLSSLDVEAVRRQMGVVLQDGQLLPGTVGDNIRGVASLSISEQWELAELVALADDIRAMPMGLDTPVMLNGGAFSGGQRQRLCLARSLAARPRILLLDEATSALDNITQRVITDNLAQLGMTRILVAHRLSTMVGADRIVVLEGGRVVEQGTYTELMATPGPFFALAERQLL
jgi:NHLM bacteriocin system ABC transporter ATP-binding protein